MFTLEFLRDDAGRISVWMQATVKELDAALPRISVGGPDPRLTATLVRSAAGVGHLIVCIHGGGCNGRYFDLPGFSFVEAAACRGYDLLLVNRPGFGGSAPPRSDRPIGEAASLLPDFVEAALARHRIDADHISVVGHSIGGAVALHWAASCPDVPSALALSGIGAEMSPAALIWWDEARYRAQMELPTDFFFGPGGSYDWRGSAALRKAAEPWRYDEVRELFEGWPAASRATLCEVRCPVHFRLAEYERIWSNDTATLARFVRSLVNSPLVDGGVALGGGHLMEVHKVGAELIEMQLDFLGIEAQLRIGRQAAIRAAGIVQ